jgi:hypothetical protein
MRVSPRGPQILERLPRYLRGTENSRRWLRVLAAYSPGVGLFVAGVIVFLTTTTTTTEYTQCAPGVNGTSSCGDPLTQYVVNSAVPILWAVALAFTLVMSLHLLTRGRWLITDPNITDSG